MNLIGTKFSSFYGYSSELESQNTIDEGSSVTDFSILELNKPVKDFRFLSIKYGLPVFIIFLVNILYLLSLGSGGSEPKNSAEGLLFYYDNFVPWLVIAFLVSALYYTLAALGIYKICSYIWLVLCSFNLVFYLFYRPGYFVIDHGTINRNLFMCFFIPIGITFTIVILCIKSK